MKTPAFWYETSSLSATILAPLGQLYRLGRFVHRSLAKPVTGKIPVICIGNIVAGGAGKTPAALALAHLLKKNGHHPVFVTRGYGGKIKGPIRVNPDKHTSEDVGDEALLLAVEATCWIGQDRVATMREAEEEKNVTHIIMDDGLQNPNITPWLSFLVIDGAVGFGNNHLIPAGPLRETLDDVLPRVAAIIMVGKDEHGIAQKCGHTVLHALIKPFIRDDFPDIHPFLAFAGLGRPEKFFASCRQIGLQISKTKSFADHYPYTEKDMENLCAEAAHHGLQLLTTAKDYVRIPEAYLHKVAALPVELVFEDPSRLLALVQAETVVKGKG